MSLTQILVFIFFAASANILYGQTKFSTDKGQISFVSKAELELIKATTDKVRGILQTSTNQFAFTIEVKYFKGFNSELQREHFLENYMEADKYPKADFNGKIIEQIDFTQDGTYEVRAKGDLTIHGQKQNRIIKAKLSITKGVISIESHFLVPLTDHNISIPKIVIQKISPDILVNFNAQMVAQQ